MIKRIVTAIRETRQELVDMNMKLKELEWEIMNKEYDLTHMEDELNQMLTTESYPG